MLIEHLEHQDIWERVARVVKPRVRVAPSVWCEQNLVLTAKMTARPGPFNADGKPWLRDVLDLNFHEPAKAGMIGKKPSQVWWSYTMIALLLYLASNDPGPILYVTTTEEEATKFANDVFDGMIGDNPDLTRLFQPVHDEKMRQLINSRQYVGGSIDFVGAATERGVISHGRKHVFSDEYQAASAKFPKASGDLFVTLTGRTEAWKEGSLIFVYGHPRYDNEDIDALYHTISDMRVWVFDCPHCLAMVEPGFHCVVFDRVVGEGTATGGDSEMDPRSAVFRCPHCGEIISDGQRSKATWPARLGGGGTGRFESLVAPEEAAKRQYIGLHIDRLADPDVTVLERAIAFVNCKTNEALQSFWNKGQGRTHKPAGSLITEEEINKRIETMQTIVVPGGPLGCHYMTAGVDVQAPEHNPVMVVTLHAWCGDGTDLVVGADVVRGWAALYEYLRRAVVTVDDRGPQGQALGTRRMGVRVCGIDCAYATGQVLDASRETIYSAATNAKIQLLPVRYQPHIKAAQPAMIWPDRKRTNPLKPWLGMIEAFDAYRDTWVDRTMRRWIDGRVRMLCERPKDFAAHMTANIRVPKRLMHGYGAGDEMVWEKVKGRRDDWGRSCDYAELAAAVKCGLDSIHLLATVAPGAVAPVGVAVQPQGGNWFKGAPGRNWW